MEDAAFESGQMDHGPTQWALEAAKGELSDDATGEIRRRAFEMLKQEKGA